MQVIRHLAPSTGDSSSTRSVSRAAHAAGRRRRAANDPCSQALRRKRMARREAGSIMMATRHSNAPTRLSVRRTGPDVERDFEFTSADFARIRELIHRRAGISLSDHKRDMAYSRLARRLRALRHRHVPAVSRSASKRSNDSAEWEAFINALTTNLTAFFREAHHFPILADFVQAPRSSRFRCGARRHRRARSRIRSR